MNKQEKLNRTLYLTTRSQKRELCIAIYLNKNPNAYGKQDNVFYNFIYKTSSLNALSPILAKI